MSIQTVPGSAAVEALVGQIADEFTQRLNRGEHPTVEEYAEKHPEIANLLRDVLPALGLIRRPDVEAALADRDPNLAEPLGDFRLLREIGRGGMGIVYEARQLSLNRRVAVKVLPFAAALDPRHLQRFRTEAEAAAKLHYEHIVPVFFIGCEGGVHFYAMQYIEGQSLAAIITEMRRIAGRGPADPHLTGPYTPPPGEPLAGELDTSVLAALTTEGSTRSAVFFQSVTRLGMEAAKGLAHAHQEGVLHRDIKPANLLMDGRGNLWITDFGLAQIRSDNQLTQTGELVGTLRYMSPEQALAKRVHVDQRTDVYSLGATLYELLTLEPVFRGNDRQELLRQIAFEDPRSPRSLNRHVPRDLETIVMTAMAKAPGHRYGSARELADDLYRFLNDQPIKAQPEGALRWLWRKSRRHAANLVLALSVVITAVALLFLVRSITQPTEKEKEQKLQQATLEDHIRDLKQMRSATLMGERGRPGYFRWCSDDMAGKVVFTQDGEFTVENYSDYGLLELLPDPQVESYRFRAEVRHEKQNHLECRVGIYFAHSERPDGDNIAHFHCNVTFNDLTDVGMKDQKGNLLPNPIGLDVHRQPHRQPLRGVTNEKAKVFGALIFVHSCKGRWHTGTLCSIAVEVRPQSIKVFWEGNLIATSSRSNLMLWARRLVAKPNEPLPPNPPQYPARGSLGLYVGLGAASFRNVVVEPLGDET